MVLQVITIYHIITFNAFAEDKVTFANSYFDRKMVVFTFNIEEITSFFNLGIMVGKGVWWVIVNFVSHTMALAFVSVLEYAFTPNPTKLGYINH